MVKLDKITRISLFNKNWWNTFLCRHTHGFLLIVRGFSGERFSFSTHFLEKKLKKNNSQINYLFSTREYEYWLVQKVWSKLIIDHRFKNGRSLFIFRLLPTFSVDLVDKHFRLTRNVCGKTCDDFFMSKRRGARSRRRNRKMYVTGTRSIRCQKNDNRSR